MNLKRYRLQVQRIRTVQLILLMFMASIIKAILAPTIPPPLDNGNKSTLNLTDIFLVTSHEQEVQIRAKCRFSESTVQAALCNGRQIAAGGSKCLLKCLSDALNLTHATTNRLNTKTIIGNLVAVHGDHVIDVGVIEAIHFLSLSCSMFEAESQVAAEDEVKSEKECQQIYNLFRCVVSFNRLAGFLRVPDTCFLMDEPKSETTAEYLQRKRERNIAIAAQWMAFEKLKKLRGGSSISTGPASSSSSHYHHRS